MHIRGAFWCWSCIVPCTIVATLLMVLTVRYRSSRKSYKQKFVMCVGRSASTGSKTSPCKTLFLRGCVRTIPSENCLCFNTCNVVRSLGCGRHFLLNDAFGCVQTIRLTTLNRKHDDGETVQPADPHALDKSVLQSYYTPEY